MIQADTNVADETPVQETKPKRERTDEQKRVLEEARKKALEVRRANAELTRKEKELERQEKAQALEARKKRVEEGLAKHTKTKAPPPTPEPEAQPEPETKSEKKPFVPEEKPTRKLILVGVKPLVTYVNSTLTQLSTLPTVTIKARGQRITQAVDVSQFIMKRMHSIGYRISDVRISSDALESRDGKTRNVSTIEIDISK